MPFKKMLFIEDLRFFYFMHIGQYALSVGKYYMLQGQRKRLQFQQGEMPRRQTFMDIQVSMRLSKSHIIKGFHRASFLLFILIDSYFWIICKKVDSVTRIPAKGCVTIIAQCRLSF